MPYNGGLRAGAVSTVDVNALDSTTLERLAGHKDLGVVGEAGLQVLDELEVVVELVVGIEVGDIWESGGAGVLGLGGAWLRLVHVSLTGLVVYTYEHREPCRPPWTCRRQGHHGRPWP